MYFIIIYHCRLSSQPDTNLKEVLRKLFAKLLYWEKAQKQKSCNNFVFHTFKKGSPKYLRTMRKAGGYNARGYDLWQGNKMCFAKYFWHNFMSLDFISFYKI